MFFQFSLNRYITSRLTPLKIQLPMAAASGDFSCLSGLDSREQLPDKDAVVGLNGEFVHIVQLGANCLNGNGAW